MKEYNLKLTNEQLWLLGKHLGMVKDIYNHMYEGCNEDIEDLWLSYIDEVEELIELLISLLKGDMEGK